MKNKIIWNSVTTMLLIGVLAGCSVQPSVQESTMTSVSSSEETQSSEVSSKDSSSISSTTAYDLSFSSSDLEVGYDESSATRIQLSDNKSSISGEGAVVEGNVVTITSEGEYIISGTLSDGQIVVSVTDTEKVHLIFNGAEITSQTSAPVLIEQADKVFITLADGSENTVSDQENSTSISGNEDDQSTIDGAIFSKADLTLNGSGSLTVNGNTKHGIVSKDELIITSGTYTITANGQGISGKDTVKIKDGTFNITSAKDAIQSDNAEDVEKGFVYIAGGDFKIESEGDAIQAETLLQVDQGTFDILTGGGSSNGVAHTSSGGMMGAFNPSETESTTSEETVSTKGLKSGSELIINGGTFSLDTADDSVHTNGDATFVSGTMMVLSGDDGIHADGSLILSGMDITIKESYEGIEGKSITVSAGNLDVTASDDGFNVAGGNDSSSLGNRPGQNTFSENNENVLTISGGNIKVNAEGDGLDSNGMIEISGGLIVIDGPETPGNGSVDSGGGATISGGTLMTVGNGGMEEGFQSESTQPSVLYNLDSTQETGSKVEVTDAEGNIVLSWTAEKTFSSIQFSSEDLQVGEAYTVQVNDVSTKIILEEMITSIGSISNSGMGMDHPNGGPGGMQPPQ